MRDPEEFSARIGDPNNIARSRVAAIVDITGKEPGMTAFGASRRLAIHFDSDQ